MRYISAILLFVMSVALAACGTSSDINRAVLDSKNGVLMIAAAKPEGAGLGTGFFIADNVILTNMHVIEGAKEIKVALDDSAASYDAEIVNQDPVADVAVIRIKDWDKFKKENSYDILKLSDDPVMETQEVYAIGHPWGLMFSISKGIVSAYDRKMDTTPKFLIETDAHVYQGNSGGPLLNSDGEVIGINSMMLAKNGGSYGFALPTSLVEKVLNDFETGDGKVMWPYIGVAISTNKVEKLIPDMPAEKAGIKVGDVITSFTTSEGTFDPVVKSLPVAITTQARDQPVKLTVLRDGKELDFEIQPTWKDSVSVLSPQ